MARNEKIEGHVKHKQHNQIVGDVPTILLDVLDELVELRNAVDTLTKRVEKLEKPV